MAPTRWRIAFAANAIRPFARALFVCDYVIGNPGGKTDLYGLFNAIRPAAYPHTQARFCVFAQLVGGLGSVPFFVDVIYRRRDELVWRTTLQRLKFPNRDSVVQLAVEIKGCQFPEPGGYLLELCFDGVCVADSPLDLSPENEDEREQANGQS